MSNLETAKELLEKYKSITLEEIIECFNNLEGTKDGYHVMHKLTGFGMLSTCMLCNAVNDKEGCNACIYNIYTKLYNIYTKFGYPCVNESYYLVIESKTPEKIYYSLQKRIEFLERTIELWKTRNN